MEPYQLRILDKSIVTHDTFAFKIEKPKGYSFVPGQATELSLLKEGWEDVKRPFSFTSLPKDDFLEFTIKTYDDHEGVTKRLGNAQVGDKVEIGDAWGAISFKGDGVFLAGGAGITPFISIFRDLRQKNEIGKSQLILSRIRKILHMIAEESIRNTLKKISTISSIRTSTYVVLKDL